MGKNHPGLNPRMTELRKSHLLKINRLQKLRILFRTMKRFFGELHYLLHPDNGEVPGRGRHKYIDRRGTFCLTLECCGSGRSSTHEPDPPPEPDGARSSERVPSALSAREEQVGGRDDQYPSVPGDTGFTSASQFRACPQEAQTVVGGCQLRFQSSPHQSRCVFSLASASAVSDFDQRLDRPAGRFPGDDRSGAFAKSIAREDSCSLLTSKRVNQQGQRRMPWTVTNCVTPRKNARKRPVLR